MERACAIGTSTLAPSSLQRSGASAAMPTFASPSTSTSVSAAVASRFPPTHASSRSIVHTAQLAGRQKPRAVSPTALLARRSTFLGRRCHLSQQSPDSKTHGRDVFPLRVKASSTEMGAANAEEVTTGEVNGSALVDKEKEAAAKAEEEKKKLEEEAEALKQQLAELAASLAAAQQQATLAEREKQQALEQASAAEAKAEAYAQDMVKTTEEAVAEVERAKTNFQAELAKLEQEKEGLVEELSLAKQEGIELALKVEKMASIAVQEQTVAITEEAKLKIAAARAETADANFRMEERVRAAADEAAASVIEEAKATIEDALEAAEIAKEQARTAEAALKDRLDVLDKLAHAEVSLIKAEDERKLLELQLKHAEEDKEALRMEIKAAVARAEAAEARIASLQESVKEIQRQAELAAKEREDATDRALEAMRQASEGRERAAAVAYKAETDSLRAATQAAQKAEKVKEQAMTRRFMALQRSLTAAEESTRAWRERCNAVEDLLTLIKERGFDVLREAGEVSDLLNRGRMDVMLGDQSAKWKLLAEGPRRERPDWLLRKTPTVVKLPKVGLDTVGVEGPAVQVEEEDEEEVADIALPKPGDVWSIVTHKVVDDVFTKEAEAKELEQREIEEKRKELEKTLLKKVPKKVKPPEELEEAKESGTGTGREIVFQGFNWESCKRQWYLEMAPKASELAASGITTVWLPPPTESVAPQGYMPSDLYNLNSAYGTKEQLQFCIEEMHNHDLLVLGDVVLNHRCAAKQNKDGVWNIFGGKLAWGPEAIVRDDPNFHGQGNPSSGDFFHAAPNIDHSQDFVRRDIKEWLQWLRADVGYDGWRLDFARGFWGGYVKEYIESSHPAFCIGEYWDSLSYEGGNPSYNQNAHRQRIINWINATGGTSSAFDVTTKGILHSALHNEYWRLIDPQGKPPGVMGWWPSRAVTFLENHDTGSTQGHWPFPRNKLMQGYAYILTHPGTPVVFYDHFYDFGIKDQIKELIAARNEAGIHCRSPVKIFQANALGYVAQVGNLVLKLGGIDWNPARQNDLMGSWYKSLDKGNDYVIWMKE